MSSKLIRKVLTGACSIVLVAALTACGTRDFSGLEERTFAETPVVQTVSSEKNSDEYKHIRERVSTEVSYRDSVSDPRIKVDLLGWKVKTENDGNGNIEWGIGDNDFLFDGKSGDFLVLDYFNNFNDRFSSGDLSGKLGDAFKHTAGFFDYSFGEDGFSLGKKLSADAEAETKILFENYFLNDEGEMVVRQGVRGFAHGHGEVGAEFQGSWKGVSADFSGQAGYGYLYGFGAGAANEIELRENGFFRRGGVIIEGEQSKSLNENVGVLFGGDLSKGGNSFYVEDWSEKTKREINEINGVLYGGFGLDRGNFFITGDLGLAAKFRDQERTRRFKSSELGEFEESLDKKELSFLEAYSFGSSFSRNGFGVYGWGRNYPGFDSALGVSYASDFISGRVDSNGGGEGVLRLFGEGVGDIDYGKLEVGREASMMSQYLIDKNVLSGKSGYYGVFGKENDIGNIGLRLSGSDYFVEGRGFVDGADGGEVELGYGGFSFKGKYLEKDNEREASGSLNYEIEF